MASSGLWENVIQPKLVLTINGTIGYVKRGAWYQDVQHQLVMLQESIPSKC